MKAQDVFAATWTRIEQWKSRPEVLGVLASDPRPAVMATSFPTTIWKWC